MKKTYNELKENKKQEYGKKDEKSEKIEKCLKTRKNTFTVSGKINMTKELLLQWRIDMILLNK